MFDGFKRILVVAPHTDDAEFGCGGSISKMVKSGLDVFVATFSACEKSVPESILQKFLLRNFIMHVKFLE